MVPANIHMYVYNLVVNVNRYHIISRSNDRTYMQRGPNTADVELAHVHVMNTCNTLSYRHIGIIEYKYFP